MHPQDVQVIRPQPSQAVTQGRDQVLAMVAGGVHVAGPGLHGVLRGQHELVAPACQQLPQGLLGGTVPVLVGGIDHIAALLGEEIQELAGRLA
jgi:hypothetical protein